MNPIVFAMRNPITTMMLVVGLIAGGALAVTRMRVDIFPSINLPRVYVILQYGGMSPSQMEGLLVNQFELIFQYVDGVKEIRSTSIQQVALIELSFYPETDMAAAQSVVVAMASRAMARMPPGTLPPMIMRMDAGSVPVGFLVLNSKTTPLGQVADLAQNILRPLVQSLVPGTVAVSPFGPNQRSILINIDPDKLRSYNLTPQDVVDALMSGNVIVPAGNIYVRDRMPMVPNNALVADIQEMGKIPLKVGKNVYIRDIGTIQDSTDVNFGYALVNGRKSVYLPIVKKDTASTLTVVADLKKALPVFRNSLPEDVTVDFAFDESPTVVASIRSVATEGFIGATLTGLMILLFLGDLRSVVVVVCNIPLALLGSLFGLYLTGNTINIMTLGGLALAIGILVDEATVEIENAHSQMAKRPHLARAVLAGNNITAVPRLLALLCILSVFIPAFIMADPLRSLFLPLSLAVGFAMISSYFLSSTFVPILCVWLLKAHHAPHDPTKKSLFERIQGVFHRVVSVTVALRWVVVPVYFLVCALLLGLVGTRIGRELFPQIDAGQFVLRYRPPPGTNFEFTRMMGVKILETIQDEVPNGVDISIGFAGQVAPNFSMNNLILFMRGPDDGWLRLALRKDSGVHLAEFRERLRTLLPEKINPWFEQLLVKEGVPPEVARERARLCSYGFEPGDIISEVMSFGSPTPIEVIVSGPRLPDTRRHATRLRESMEQLPGLRDVQFHQSLDYPTVEVNIDRERAGLSGMTVKQVGDGVLVATSSSRYVALNYWQNPKTGFDYQVEVLVPTQRMTTPLQVETLPIEAVNAQLNMMVRDVARVREGVMPGQIDRLSSQRYISITANVEGTDLGRAARSIEAAIQSVGDPPRGVRVFLKGQLAPMNEMFQSLAIGLSVAVFVILVLLTGYFQSPRLALVSIGSVPGVLSGVVVMLYLTRTTLNIESFMGTIMCIGVSVSNSVMMVTFIAQHWHSGMEGKAAAIHGAAERLRPILMTATAMTVGTIPMALALEEGSDMLAPLGRAVIGGLIMSTIATLLVVPSLFALLISSRKHRSPSLFPEDPDSRHYDPHPESAEHGHGHPHAPPATGH